MSGLKQQFKEKFDKFQILDWGKKPSEKCFMVINTTSVGLKKEDKLSIDFRDYKISKPNDLANNFIFVDLIYNHKTIFLKEAEKRGNLIIDGKGMFLGQAKHAFNIWTNILPKIEEDTKAVVYVVDGDKGEVSISGKNSDIINFAKQVILDLVKDVEEGEVYDGKVVKIMNFGAFIELLPGKEALLHISKIAQERVEKVEDYLSIGEVVKVKVSEIDRQGRANLVRIFD